MCVEKIYCNFAVMNEIKWSENIILTDAEYIDKVAFDLIVNFERMLGRRIPPADMARWLDCVALDGGMRELPQAEGSTERVNEVLAVFIHDKRHGSLNNYAPSDFSKELNGKAFKDHLGEFSISALPVEEITTKADFFIDTLQLVCAQSDVKRVMVVASDELYDRVRQILRNVDDEKRITVFGMQPREGGNFRQEILGYSLMAALGIRSEEIMQKT